MTSHDDTWACGYANSPTATKHFLFDDCNLDECYRVETSFEDPIQRALFYGEHPWDQVQCPLYIATFDIAAALPIATSTPVTDLRHYINSNLVYNDLKFRPLFSK